jgi:hypothetical protein
MRRWLWPIAIALLTALLVILLFRPSAEAPVTEPAPTQTPSTEWTTAPEGSAVDVRLPKTPMRNVPADEQAESQPAPAQD